MNLLNISLIHVGKNMVQERPLSLLNGNVGRGVSISCTTHYAVTPLHTWRIWLAWLGLGSIHIKDELGVLV